MLLDTTADAARTRWRILAAMTGEARLRQALELTDLVFRIAADGLRARTTGSVSVRQAHPEGQEAPPS
jgi:hypothetical protein